MNLPTLSYLLLDAAKPFIHRDLSWIQFNDRVLDEAQDRTNPLLKRMKFLSISSSNLDEFFMIRFASLLRSISATKSEEGRASLQRIHGTVLESVRKFGLRQSRTFLLLKKEAERKNIFFPRRTLKNQKAHEIGRKIFQEKVLPQLLPQSAFHYSKIGDLQNLQILAYLSKNLFFVLPRTIPASFWEIQGNHTYVFFLDDLLLSHLEEFFPGKGRPGLLRITRDSDFTVDLSESDPESVPDIIRKNLGSRDKGKLVRLQYSGYFPATFLQEASHHLRLDLRQTLKAPGTLCLHGLMAYVGSLPISEDKTLSHPALRSTVPMPFETSHQGQLFAALREVDFILHHPYDSFSSFLSWLKQAVKDPDVTMIEQTIYRTDSVSEIVDLLKKAAASKKVRVMLELRARFDEFNNLQVAEDLRKAGVEVHFGFGSLKLHAKLTLISRKENGKIHRYTHLSTGNYNAKTAQQYTDISILTANPEIGDDARLFFDSLARQEVPSQFQHLVTAPTKLHQKIRSLIKAETEAAKAGKRARIIAKVNALVDEKIIEDLYAASKAGVSIDLIVRGACSLIPGVKDLSENIRVISIVDRFLEHSRIYYFEHSEMMYLSSADWMPRNFFSRLEIAFPVLDRRLYRFIADVVLPGYLQDNVKARRLNAKGIWSKMPKSDRQHRAQWYFEELAAQHYKGTPLFDHPFFQRSKTS